MPEVRLTEGAFQVIALGPVTWPCIHFKIRTISGYLVLRYHLTLCDSFIRFSKRVHIQSVPRADGDKRFFPVVGGLYFLQLFYNHSENKVQGASLQYRQLVNRVFCTMDNPWTVKLVNNFNNSNPGNSMLSSRLKVEAYPEGRDACGGVTSRTKPGFREM